MEKRTRQQIMKDLLCNAFEGGSNYWYRIDGYIYPAGKTHKDLEAQKAAENPDSFEKTFFPHTDLPFMGGAVQVRDMEGEQGLVALDLKKCRRGLKLMEDPANGLAHHWADVLKENDDATTGDVFLQLALWGKLIYG